MTADSAAPPLDTSVAHSARVWNYWLGGKDNYQVDRETGDRVTELPPDIVLLARAARGFLARAVGYLAADAGVRQFLGIGTGLPTASNTHQIAQAATPDSPVVYVDNDGRQWSFTAGAPPAPAAVTITATTRALTALIFAGSGTGIDITATPGQSSDSDS